MVRSVDGYIDSATIELIKRLGCNECRLFSLRLITDFSKFIGFILAKKEIITLIFSSFLSEKEKLTDIAKDLGKRKQIAVYVFFSDALSADTFAVCYNRKPRSLERGEVRNLG